MPLSIRMPLFAASALTLFALLLAWTPAASASDKDCADFPSQRAAQIFFLKHGGPRNDPHRLDGDNDGVACEDNPCPCYRKKHLPYRPALSLAAAYGGRLAAWSSSTPVEPHTD
ncbi:MAG: micrococcal nuclease [Solirubrobacterales bacterium]|nr:micrococcal nuclease [Solirubrobacterales bacterium]